MSRAHRSFFDKNMQVADRGVEPRRLRVTFHLPVWGDIENASEQCAHPHEHNVTCTFMDGTLQLVAENNYDPEGLNLLDEFSDNICAYIKSFDGDMKLVSVEVIS